MRFVNNEPVVGGAEPPLIILLVIITSDDKFVAIFNGLPSHVSPIFQFLT